MDNAIVKQEFCSIEDAKKLKQFYSLKAEADIIEKEIRQNAKEYMKENGILSMENDDYKFTYIPESTRKDVDRKKMADDGVLEIYQKETPINDSVRITVKW